MSDGASISFEFSGTAAVAVTAQWDYYAMREGPELAERWQSAVGQSASSLCTSPERGSRCRLSAKALSELRWIPVKGFPFRLFYLYERAARELVIIHVLHEKRDIDDLLEAAIREQ